MSCKWVHLLCIAEYPTFGALEAIPNPYTCTSLKKKKTASMLTRNARKRNCRAMPCAILMPVWSLWPTSLTHFEVWLSVSNWIWTRNVREYVYIHVHIHGLRRRLAWIFSVSKRQFHNLVSTYYVLYYWKNTWSVTSVQPIWQRSNADASFCKSTLVQEECRTGSDYLDLSVQTGVCGFTFTGMLSALGTFCIPNRMRDKCVSL